MMGDVYSTDFFLFFGANHFRELVVLFCFLRAIFFIASLLSRLFLPLFLFANINIDVNKKRPNRAEFARLIIRLARKSSESPSI